MPEPERAASPFRLPGLPSFGGLCFGALVVCVASGIVLMSGFEPAQPVASTLAFETGRPFGWFFRALHAWSAELALVSLLLHTLEYVARRADRASGLAAWLTAAVTLPLTLYLMLGGRALVGDTEGQAVASVLHGLITALPAVGRPLADTLVGATQGGSAHLLLTHHVATGTLLLAAALFSHLRRSWPDAIALAVALGLSGLVALAFRPALGAVAASGAALRGPWFMGGLRISLGLAPVWLVGIVVPAVAWGLLVGLPLVRDRPAGRLRLGLGAVAIGYAAATLVAQWR